MILINVRLKIDPLHETIHIFLLKRSKSVFRTEINVQCLFVGMAN